MAVAGGAGHPAAGGERAGPVGGMQGIRRWGVPGRWAGSAGHPARVRTGPSRPSGRLDLRELTIELGSGRPQFVQGRRVNTLTLGPNSMRSCTRPPPGCGRIPL